MPAPAAGPLTAVTIGQCRLRSRRRNGWNAVSSAAPALLRPGFCVVAALQVGAGAERAARAGHDQAPHLGLPLLDLVQRLGEPAEHVDRHRVHHLLMIEGQDRDRSVKVERDVLELHGFLAVFGPRVDRGTAVFVAEHI